MKDLLKLRNEMCSCTKLEGKWLDLETLQLIKRGKYANIIECTADNAFFLASLA